MIVPPFNIAKYLPLGASRPPARLDDANRGYAAGNLWLDRGDVYACNDPTAGVASWYPLPRDAAYPCDAVSGAVAAYGLVKLVAAYAGASFRVVRASDGTTKDIGFVKTLINGRVIEIADVQALDAFLVGTTGAVSILYDQTANGYNATQATAAKMPVIGHKTWFGIRYITFMGDAPNTGTISELDIPSAVSLTCNATSQYAVMAPFTSITSNAFWELGSGGTSHLVYQDFNGSAFDIAINRGGSGKIPLFPTSTKPSVFSCINSTSQTAFAQGNKAQTVSVSTSATLTGGMIGNTSKATNYQGRFDFGALILYGSAHTAANQQAVISRLTAMFGLAPQTDVVLSYEGDSITYGRTLVEGKDRSQYLAAKFGEDFLRYNWGVGGQPMYAIATSFQYRSALVADPTKLNILVLFGGTNDLKLYSLSGATAWGSTVTTMQSARAAGYKILVATMLPRSDFSAQNETDRQSYNALARANAITYADGLLDFAADVVMGASGAPSNTTLYADGVHPTDLGQGLLDAIEAPMIQSLVQAWRSSHYG